ncbi:hypothetical protein L6452_08460 [Arctium lappa]|uniref:Uncharacterized protein n=1 Tax=Arctium lappa TaxID=4217 RepID=A0ACB9DHD1_ARCLA|nr:hypothetical protein L6452_08460 [Arctium lappa]
MATIVQISWRNWKQSEEYLVLGKPPALLMLYLLRDIEAASDDQFGLRKDWKMLRLVVWGWDSKAPLHTNSS